MHKKLRITTILFFLSLFIFNIMILSNYEVFSKLSTIITFIITYLLVNIAINIGWHRYFCHNSFKTSKFMEFIFLLIGSASFFGNINTWITEHNHHHENKKNDIFNPGNNLFTSIFWWAFDTNVDSRAIITRYKKDRLYLIFNNYYILISIFTNILFMSLFYLLESNFILAFFYGVSLRVQIFHILYSLSHAFGHSQNKILKNFHFLNLGEGNHEEHHLKPKENNFKNISWIIYVFLKKIGLISN